MIELTPRILEARFVRYLWGVVRGHFLAALPCTDAFYEAYARTPGCRLPRREGRGEVVGRGGEEEGHRYRA